jgi:serine/threonine protein kinase
VRALRSIPAPPPEPERGPTARGSAARGDEKVKDPLLGALVGGRFRVERLLANGGMGRVYVARHEGLQRRVALKVVHHDDDPLAEDEGQQRFRVEAELLGRLVHPNIVIVHDFGELEGPDRERSYLAMELLDGPTLAERMDAETRLPIGLVLELAEQMVNGLRFAHAHGIVHRDMKPSNVVLMPCLHEDAGPHRLKIIDFGTGKMLGPEVHELSGRRLTKEGYTIGTPEYMAPEQLAGRPCAASDLFAVGVIMFEALAGVLPFRDAQASRALAPRLRDVAPDLVVPAAVDSLVASLLARRPADRPTSSEVLLELRRCLDDLLRVSRQPSNEATKAPRAVLSVAPEKRSRPRPLVAGAVGAISTLVIVLVGLRFGTLDERPLVEQLPCVRRAASTPRALVVEANRKAVRVGASTLVEAEPEPQPVADTLPTRVRPPGRASSPPSPVPYTEFKTTGF